MITTIKFDDGQTHNVPDISYEKFVEYMFESGSSDTEYAIYLRDNNMKEITDFNSESTNEITLLFEDDNGRKIEFRCVYDSDNEI